MRVALLGNSIQVCFFCNFTCNEFCKKEVKKRAYMKAGRLALELQPRLVSCISWSMFWHTGEITFHLSPNNSPAVAWHGQLPAASYSLDLSF